MADEIVEPIEDERKRAKRARHAARTKRWRASNPDRDKTNRTAWRVNNYDRARSAERVREERRKAVKAQRRHARRLEMSAEEKQKLAKKQRIWRKNNSVADQQIRHKSYRKHSKARLKQNSEARKNDPQRWMAHVLAARLRLALRRGDKSGVAVSRLGCSIVEFRTYIEAKFAPGMNWENWGIGISKWHLDHIRPLASFDLSDVSQLAEAVHFSNYQPLWSVDNLRKGARIGLPPKLQQQNRCLPDG